MKYLNLGCGIRFHEEWVNVDMDPLDVKVIRCNFINGIPFEDNSYDAVYHSHVLEHFPRKQAVLFISECYRILKPGGVLRVVTPNLERLATEYLQKLNAAVDGSEKDEKNYDWIMLELYDQAVRNRIGGEMGDFLRSDLVNEDYVSSRIGNLKQNNSHIRTKDLEGKMQYDSRETAVSKLMKRVKGRMLSLILNEFDKRALNIGRFRYSGEIHQWLYDRFSLSRLLRSCGFKDIALRTADESYIPGWKNFKLDNPNETASIFIEGKK